MTGYLFRVFSYLLNTLDCGKFLVQAISTLFIETAI